MKYVMLCMVFAVLLYSCANNKMKEAKSTVASSDMSLAKIEEKPAGNASPSNFGALQLTSSESADSTATDGKSLTPQSGTPAGNPDWDKKIIKTANITLELKDYNAYNTGIHGRVRSYGAYIAQEQQSETNGQIMNEITIKVPVDKFEDIMASLGGEGVKVIQKNITTEDVTGEVVDTKARMEAKKQVRDRYLELLKQAKSMKDILDVQEQINGIQEDIESAAGRVNYLTHSAAYSTVNIKYYQFLNGVTARDIEPNFFTKIAVAFKTGFEIITNIVLFAVSIWPLLAASILLVFYFKKNAGKRQKPAVIE